jgi:hypothetical protein
MDRGDMFVALARNIHEDKINALSDDDLKKVRQERGGGLFHVWATAPP